MTDVASVTSGASARGSSFYAAMRLLPLARRDAMFAIYAFCRVVDDIADGEDAPAEKRRQLARWREEIDALFSGRPSEPVARALAEPVRAFELRRADFLAVIDGMDMDAEADIVAPDMATLDLYCDRVASAVGRLSVRAFGAKGEAADRVAHHLGRALQLANILRDIAEDAARGRLYLPADLLRAHGVAWTPIQAALDDPNLRAVCRDLAAIAYRHFDDAEAAMAACPRRAMRTARIMGAAYRAILDRLVAWDWRDLTTPVKVPLWLKIWILVRHGVI